MNWPLSKRETHIYGSGGLHGPCPQSTQDLVELKHEDQLKHNVH
jgi:hypothetical protein